MLIARGENLAAVDYIVVACAPGEGFDFGSFRAGVGFRHSEGLQPEFARSDTRQVAALLFLVPMLEQRRHRVHLGVAGGGVAPGMIYLLENYRTVEHRKSGPAIFLRNERGKPSGFAERAHEFLGIGVALVTLAPVVVAEASAQA